MLRGFRGAVAVQAEDHPRPLERGVVLDTPWRLRLRGRLRGRHELPRPRGDTTLPRGYSETEILFPYGPTSFASKLGQLAGNHFLTITDGLENLRPLGEMTLWKGAQDITFDHG